MAATVPTSELHRVVSTVIIYNGNKYLLLQRSLSENAFPGKWTVPGGGLSPKDYINTKPSTKARQWYFAIVDGLRREVKEETNLEIGQPTLLCDVVFIRPDGVPAIVLSYFAPYKSGKVKIGSDQAGFAWVPVAEAKKYDLIDGILEEIMMVDRMIHGNKKIDIKKEFLALVKKKYA